MRYKVGDKVRIKSLDWYTSNKDKFGKVWTDSLDGESQICFDSDMIPYCGMETVIFSVERENYVLKGIPYAWTDEMIEGLVEEALKQYEVPTGSIKIWDLPNGHIFKDENGNVINATKIVLERKKKEVILTQEQIDTMVHESCVLFCKYCGCGVPKETCTSLGTCKDHDEYRKSMRTYLENHKK